MNKGWREEDKGMKLNVCLQTTSVTAVAVSMRTIVLTQQLGLKMLTQSFGVVALFQGVFFTLDPPMAGKSHMRPSTFRFRGWC